MRFSGIVLAGMMALGIITPVAGVNTQLGQMLEKKVVVEQKTSELEPIGDTDEEIISDLLGYTPTNDEIMLMKRIAMAEAGGTEPIVGIERVLEVIINRVNSTQFPDTITKVAYQRNQFQTVMEDTIWKYQINKRVEKAYSNLLDRGYCLDDKVLYFTAEGYNPYCIPAYKLGNHYFGY